MKLIYQGGEAKIYKEGKTIVKERVRKGYRHPMLDESIRKKRTKKEARIMEKLYGVVDIPKIITIEKYKIVMEYIPGKKLSNIACKKPWVMELLGKSIGTIHNHNISHGDLTTSNAILWNKKVWLIDFGLSNFTTKIEDYAVDLHILKEAIESKHYGCERELWRNFLKGYKVMKKYKIVLERLKKIEKRGRYKSKR